MPSFLEVIEEQLVANRLPLAGITIAATPFPNTPAVLSLHWHAFVEITLAPEGNAVAYQSVPSSALQVSPRWDRIEDIEASVLETAWELGAWDLRRIEARACARPGAAPREYIECETSFGVSPQAIDGEPVFVSEVPDGQDLVAAASRAGYLCWQFRPTWCGLWKELAKDVTLEKGGYRNPTCPLAAQAYEPGRSRTVVFQLGVTES
ncbi:MAG: diguanylate cyclase [Betaproteobacteria bacterium]|nr:MAG: diguanylate cyclase [Betaproteobacteria bacterium]